MSSSKNLTDQVFANPFCSHVFFFFTTASFSSTFLVIYIAQALLSGIYLNKISFYHAQYVFPAKTSITRYPSIDQATNNPFPEGDR